MSEQNNTPVELELLEEYWLDPNFSIKTAVLGAAALGQLKDKRAFEESVRQQVEGLISLQTDMPNGRITLNYSPQEVEARELKKMIAELLKENY